MKLDRYQSAASLASIAVIAVIIAFTLQVIKKQQQAARQAAVPKSCITSH